MTVSQIMELAVRDPDFYARLIANPTETSKAAGLVIRDGEQVRIYEQRQNEMHLFLSCEMADGELNDADLEMVAGGTMEAFLRRVFSGNATSSIY